MKILITHSDPELPARESIDLWRIIRPFNELKKHVDWQIDSQSYLIDHTLIDKESSKVDTDKLVKEIERLGKYDLVWSSYFPDATLYDAMIFTSMKFGTKFVLDVDDDFYHIPEHNPIFKQDDVDKNIKAMQYCVENAPYLVTSTERLKNEYSKRRKNPTYVLPNYIGGYKHRPFDNKDKVVIGFFGGVSHLQDVEKTGFMEALRKIMNKYKHVHAGSVGLKLPGYLPKDRYTFHPGIPGQRYVSEVWPNINLDIAVAPLENTPFNRAKTNIKWLETALIPAAFVGSRIPPYLGTVDEEKTGLLVRDGVEMWYSTLEKLVLDSEYRQQLALNARDEVLKNWSIENKWQDLKKIIEEVRDDEAATLE